MNAWYHRHEIHVAAQESLARQTRRREARAWQDSAKTSGSHDRAEAADAGRDCSDVHDSCGVSGAVWSSQKPCTPEAHRQAYTHATMLRF